MPLSKESAAMYSTCKPRELELWERRAAPGSRLVYFSGESIARAAVTDTEKQRPAPELADVINRIRSLYNLGHIDLFQRRTSIGERNVGTFDYFAVWRDRPAKVPTEHRLMPMIPFA